MLVSHSHKFVFVHIPKTAGTSLAAVLEPYCDSAPDSRFRRLLRKAGVKQDPKRAHFRSHDKARDVLAAFGRETMAGYTVFSVVRNPFDHAISHYAHLKSAPRPWMKEMFSALDFSGYLAFRENPDAFPKTRPFAAIRDQMDFLCDDEGRSLADRVLRFERLQGDLDALTSDLGLPGAELPRKRVTEGRRRNFRDYFETEAQVEAVRRIYRRDFEAFGYDLELPGDVEYSRPTT